MYKKSATLKKIRAAVEKKTGITDACKYAGITYSTLHAWEHRYPRVKRYMDRVLRARIKHVEDALVRSALTKDNTTAQIFFLKSQAGWRDHENNTTVNTQVNITNSWQELVTHAESEQETNRLESSLSLTEEI